MEVDFSTVRMKPETNMEVKLSLFQCCKDYANSCTDTFGMSRKGEVAQ